MPIQDDFNRGSLGSNWVNVVGAAWVMNGSVETRPSTDNLLNEMRRAETSFPNDHYAQARCEFTGGIASGPAVRMGASGQGYGVQFDATTVTLYDLIGGGSINSLATAGNLATANTYYTIKIVATGTSIQVYVEGVLKITFTSSTYTSGKPGLISAASAGFFLDCDDFECTDAIGSGGGQMMMRGGG